MILQITYDNIYLIENVKKFTNMVSKLDSYFKFLEELIHDVYSIKISIIK